MRILIIEDDVDIAEVVSRGLRSEGFDVDVADNGVDGLWRAEEGSYAAIILDLLIPGLNGYQVCRAIRQAGVDTPLLVLTAKEGADDQIDLLELGADGFLTKPTTVSVIVANLRALLRRGPGIEEAVYVCGELEYDQTTQRCRFGGKNVDLTSREHAVLLELLRAGGHLRRDELLRSVWGFDHAGDPGIIDVYLRRLRQKLSPDVIENRRGLGYRIRDCQDR